eukprot:GHRQ01022778.1.p4 GENE.GHRQ01022778.1~~GHRQ01022778.1.p4  ORF type:complete len:104 (+),score=9.44 GHRQ01022778.1:517-828(+)
MPCLLLGAAARCTNVVLVLSMLFCYLQINDEASDRVLAVEQEFNKRRRPIYRERSYSLSRIPGFWKKVGPGFRVQDFVTHAVGSLALRLHVVLYSLITDCSML